MSSKSWSLSEAVSVSALDKHLLKFKGPIKGKLQGKLGEYVDILEFVVDWFANRTGGSDEDFDMFMKKLTASYDSSEVGKDATFTAKKKKEKEIEAEPEIELDTDDFEVEPTGVHDPHTKTHSSDKNTTPEKNQPGFGAPPDAPSLSALAGKDSGDESSGDFWDKVTKNAQDLHKKMPTDGPDINPVDGPKDDKAKTGSSKRFKTGAKQEWKPGAVVDVGFVHNLLVKGKKGRFWHLVGKNGQEYVFEPHVGLKKFTKTG